MSEKEQVILVSSSDGQVWKVKEKIVMHFLPLRTMVESLGEPAEQEIIPFPNVRSSTLALVLAWMSHHLDELPLPDTDKEPRECNWDKHFFEGIPKDELLELARICSFLDCTFMKKGLSRYLADSIRRVGRNEIGQLFGLEKTSGDHAGEKVSRPPDEQNHREGKKRTRSADRMTSR